MKVVLDTNVLVSGILFMGPPHRILLAWSEGRCELVFTSDIHEEYRRVAAELQQQFPRVDLAAGAGQRRRVTRFVTQPLRNTLFYADRWVSMGVRSTGRNSLTVIIFIVIGRTR